MLNGHYQEATVRPMAYLYCRMCSKAIKNADEDQLDAMLKSIPIKEKVPETTTD